MFISDLRFIERDGKHILQARYQGFLCGDEKPILSEPTDWEDVNLTTAPDTPE